MTVKLHTPETMPRRGGYSQVAEVTKSKLVLIAGQVPHDVNDKLVGEGDFAAQVEQVFKNADAAVRAAGGTFANVVKINNYLVDIPANIGTFREVRDQYLNMAAPPASTAVGVPALARPGALFEIEAIAVL